MLECSAEFSNSPSFSGSLRRRAEDQDPTGEPREFGSEIGGAVNRVRSIQDSLVSPMTAPSTASLYPYYIGGIRQPLSLLRKLALIYTMMPPMTTPEKTRRDDNGIVSGPRVEIRRLLLPAKIRPPSRLRVYGTGEKESDRMSRHLLSNSTDPSAV